MGFFDGFKRDFGSSLSIIRATKGNSIDREVLIIGKVVGWSGGVPKGLPCGELRSWSVSSGACFFRLVFEWASEAIFFDFLRFLMDFGWVLEAQMGAKIDFFGVFLGCFFRNALFNGLWVDFRRLRP